MQSLYREKNGVIHNCSHLLMKKMDVECFKNVRKY